MEEADVELVAVAIDDVQARVYRKLLEDQGIKVLLADSDDAIIGSDVVLEKSIQNVKVIVHSKDAERAKDIIQEFESSRKTRVISKSGKHIMFKCVHCEKYVYFSHKDRGTSQFCPECLRIIQLPE